MEVVEPHDIGHLKLRLGEGGGERETWSERDPQPLPDSTWATPDRAGGGGVQTGGGQEDWRGLWLGGQEGGMWGAWLGGSPRGAGPSPDRRAPRCTAWRRRWVPGRTCKCWGCSRRPLENGAGGERRVSDIGATSAPHQNCLPAQQPSTTAPPCPTSSSPCPPPTPPIAPPARPTPPGARSPRRQCCAPSRHSGDSSLSAKEPSSSDTRRSACSGAVQSRMSDDTTVTCEPHSSYCQLSRLQGVQS